MMGCRDSIQATVALRGGLPVAANDPIAQHTVLGLGVRDGVTRLLGSRPQAGKCSDRVVVVEPAIDESAAGDGAGSSFAAPAVHVDDPAGIDFAVDVGQDFVVPFLADRGVEDREASVPRPGPPRLFDLFSQHVGVWVHVVEVVRVGQIDERVDAGVDEHTNLLPR